MTRKAAMYLRISLDIDGRGAGVQRQREDCKALIEKNGWELVDEYVDNSVSASKDNVTRPEYNRMENDYDAGLFDTIVCYHMDRLTRRPIQMEQWINRAEKEGLVVATCTGDYDLRDEDGRTMARIVGALARGEIERKSARQKRAVLQKAQKGGRPSGAAPYGYDNEYKIVEDRAETVRGIYRAIQAGVSMADIVRALNGEAGRDEEVPWLSPCTSPGVLLWQQRNEKRVERGMELLQKPKETKWTHHMVLRIGSNPTYAGYRVHIPEDAKKKREHRGAGSETAPGRRMHIVRDSDGELVTGFWEPIVDKNLWWSVSEILCDPRRDKRKHNRSGKAGLGSGLYICGECGYHMTTLGLRYRCRQCGISRTREPIDRLVCSVVDKILSREDVVEELVSRKEPTEESKVIEQQIKDLQARIKNAESDFDDDLITARDLKRKRDKAQATIDDLRRDQVKMLPEATQSVLTGMQDPAAGFRDSSLVTRRAIIDALMEVRLYKAKVGRKQFDPKTVEIEWKVDA